jgi:hypothetical protein
VVRNLVTSNKKLLGFTCEEGCSHHTAAGSNIEQEIGSSQDEFCARPELPDTYRRFAGLEAGFFWAGFTAGLDPL